MTEKKKRIISLTKEQVEKYMKEYEEYMGKHPHGKEILKQEKEVSEKFAKEARQKEEAS